MNNKSTIIITGAGGFVGSNLSEYLQDEFAISPMSVRYSPGQVFRFNEADTVIHLSGKAHDLKKTSALQMYYEANFELTKQLYDAFLRSDARIFIFMSSVKAAADLVEGVLTENMLAHPQTDYGKSKRMTEEYILSQPLPQGKRYFILRPCMIHGPDNKGNLNLLYRFVTKGLLYPLASFENYRSFLSVTNLCFVIKEFCTRSDIPSGIYQVADDQPLSTNRVIQLMGEALNKKVHFWRIPEKAIHFLARIGDSLGLPLNSERLEKLTENYVVSNEKLLAALQKPLPLTAEEGLRITLQSFSAKQATKR